MLVRKSQIGNRLALALLVAGLFLAAWRVAPSSAQCVMPVDDYEVDKGHDSGDPDMPDQQPPPRSLVVTDGSSTTSSVGSGAQAGTVRDTRVYARRYDVWATWKYVLKFMLQHGFYVP